MTQGKRKPRVDRGHPRMTDRDLIVLKWIGEQYAIRVDHLQILLARFGKDLRIDDDRVALNTMRSHLARWRKLGLVNYRKVLQSKPSMVWLTPTGLREMGLEFTYVEPSSHTFNHISACNQTRLLLESKWPLGQWVSERYTRAGAAPLGGKNYIRIVDAVFHLDDEVIGVEVELSNKGKERLAQSVALAADQYETVWYFCAPSLNFSIQQAITTLPPSAIHRVKIFLLGNLEE